MPELVIKSAIQNGDLPKPKPTNDSSPSLEHQRQNIGDILKQHYIDNIKNRHGDIMKVFPKK